MLIVDGYNVIFSASRYEQARAAGLDVAVEKLITDLVNLAAFQGIDVIVVFDGQEKAKQKAGRVEIIFTSPKQTADEVIQKIVFNLQEPATVCTNDYAQQKVIFRPGVLRLTVNELTAQFAQNQEEIKSTAAGEKAKLRLADRLSPEIKAKLKKWGR